MNSVKLKGQRETTCSSSSSRDKTGAVKLEIAEDPLEEEYGPLHKRPKASQTIQQVFFQKTLNILLLYSFGFLRKSRKQGKIDSSLNFILLVNVERLKLRNF